MAMAGNRRLCAPCFCGIAANSFLAKRGVPLVIGLDNGTVCSAAIMNRLVRSTWSLSPPPICHDAQNHGELWADPVARLGKHKAGPSRFPADFLACGQNRHLGLSQPFGANRFLAAGLCLVICKHGYEDTEGRHPMSKRASAVWFEGWHYWLAPMYAMARTEDSSVRPAANRGSPTTQLVGLMDAAKAIRRSRS
ncbi:hypothetical protein J3F84DRAFT_100282 [Trichoderma pleuroticola]